jgi:hypothetical protein
MISGDFPVTHNADNPYANPDYITDPCRYLRVAELFYFTLEECDMSRRLLCSVLLGGIIGYGCLGQCDLMMRFKLFLFRGATSNHFFYCPLSIFTSFFNPYFNSYERRSVDRPAGIRTMGLVSLGACSFTISSIMAFKSSTMGWDAVSFDRFLPQQSHAYFLFHCN